LRSGGTKQKETGTASVQRDQTRVRDGTHLHHSDRGSTPRVRRLAYGSTQRVRRLPTGRRFTARTSSRPARWSGAATHSLCAVSSRSRARDGCGASVSRRAAVVACTRDGRGDGPRGRRRRSWWWAWWWPSDRMELDAKAEALSARERACREREHALAEREKATVRREKVRPRERAHGERRRTGGGCCVLCGPPGGGTRVELTQVLEEARGGTRFGSRAALWISRWRSAVAAVSLAAPVDRGLADVPPWRLLD
jgi:hypothetical protein